MDVIHSNKVKRSVGSQDSRRYLSAAVWTFLFLVPFESARSAEATWPKEPYNYLIIDQDLRDVFVEFGRNIRIPIKVSDAVAKRRVRNDLTLSTPREFLQRLCDAYGLVWYYDGAVLHVSDDSEVRTELFNTGPVGAETLLGRLSSLGISDPRFAIRASGNAGVITASGPPPYLMLVRSTLDALQKASAPRPVQEVTNGDALRVRVFRGGRQGS